MWQNWLCIEIIVIMRLVGYILTRVRFAINNSRLAIGFDSFVDMMENKYFKYIIFAYYSAIIPKLYVNAKNL
ncbi:MAG: hypothetical protein K6U80_05290 [Firmicutes bacterium]|nr:hypothetical protein [Bacillota bacterium]